MKVIDGNMEYVVDIKTEICQIFHGVFKHLTVVKQLPRTLSSYLTDDILSLGIFYLVCTGCCMQAGALVHVYVDGSVLVAHGGTEMGQGLHTKMIQVASRVLKVPTSLIHISETSTATVPNTSPTAASSSSDLYGMAIVVGTLCQSAEVLSSF